MGRPRALETADEATLRALLGWVRARLDESGSTYEQLADDVGYSRPWVSGELSGRRLPSWRLMEAIAARAHAPADEAQRLHRAAEAALDHPPSDIDSWQGLYLALDALILSRVGSHQELVRRDASGVLTRSTIDAIALLDRSLSEDVLVRALTICEVGERELADWMKAWESYGRVRREEMDDRRRAIARHRLQSDRRARRSW
ncbi:MAG: family transcriptional regulator [Actinomycetia bacterium]|nr:family transcriptional regulator [Actinomycetes bacterium]